MPFTNHTQYRARAREHTVEPGFFRGPIIYFRELLTEANFAKDIFAIRSKPDYTHVGALREEGVAPKIWRNIFSRLAEIREIRENKCPRKNPAIR